MLWIIVFVITAMYLMTRKSPYTDEVTVQKVIRNIKSQFPSLEPVNTTSIDSGTARITFFDTNTYSGKVIDASTRGVLPRAPPDTSIQPYKDAEYKSYDEIRKM